MIDSNHAEREWLSIHTEEMKSDKKIFLAYEKVRERGCYNMVLNATGAAGLDRDEYLKVMETIMR